MKSNDWRHKNVARYTPGNTKILYFFNCLLDGMHTKIKHICDFSRGGLNARFEATNMLYFLMDCCVNLVRFDFPDYFYLS